MNRPVFADSTTAWGWWKRHVIGVFCAFVSLAVIAAVCHSLESFREQVEEEHSARPAPMQSKSPFLPGGTRARK